MQSAHFGPTTYVIVFVALVLLTFTTVGASLLPLSGSWHIAIGLSIGLAKASLVALVFMHLAGGQRLTWSILAVTLLWLTVLFALTFADYLSRGLIPGMPGH